jgi:RND family efflux transporter MFP subunit
MKRFLFPAFIFFFAACGKPEGPSPGGGGGQMPPALVTLATVETRELVEWEEFTGRVEPTEMVELKPRVSGYITAVRFEAGEFVEEGEILFTIDQRAFETRLRAATAEVARARAIATAAKSEFARVQELLSARALAPEQAEMRESIHLQAEAALEAALAAEHSAAIEMEHTEVRAPISGRISRAITTPGNFVSAGMTLLTTIVTTDPVYVYTDIDENSLLRLQALQRDGGLYVDEQGRVPVEVQLSNESRFDHRGFIESFDNRLDAGTGSMVLRCEFPNRDGRLMPGLFARVRLPMTTRYPALLIDERSVLTDQANKFVLGVDEQNLSVYKPVVLGPSIEGKRIVRKGLSAGERIIINGMARLPQPGMPVEPVEADTGDSPEKVANAAASGTEKEAAGL